MDNTIKKTADVLAEEWCQAVELLVQQSLKNLPYDQTIVCTVVDNSQKIDNIYLVQNGDMKFKAYAEDNTMYQINDQVRVSILNGEFSEKKFIVGKYAAASNESRPYVFSTDTVLQMHNSLSASYIPADFDDYVGLWATSFPANTYTDKTLYDTLALEFAVTTDMEIENPYDITILLKSQNNICAELKFLHSEFIGNPFTFYLPSTQQKIFNIAEYNNITNIEIYLHATGNPQPIVQIKKVYIGSQLAYQENQQFKIFTPDSMTYRIGSENNLTRQLGLQWINKTELNEYIGFSNGIYEANYDEISYLKQKEYNEALVALKSSSMPVSFDALKAYYDYQQARKFFPELEKNLDNFIDYIKQLRFSNYAQLLKGFTIQNNDGAIQQVDSIDFEAIYTKIALIADLIKKYNSTGLPNTMNALMNAVKQVELGQAANWELIGTEPAIEYQTLQNNLFAPLVIGIESSEEIIGADRIALQEFQEYIADYKNAREAILAYKQTIEQNFAIILPYIQNIKNYLQTVYTTAEPPIEEYNLLKSADYDNRYSIYWYQYQEGYMREEAVGEKEYFLPIGWKRLEQYDNFGVPAGQEAAAADGKTYLESHTLQPVITGNDAIVLDEHQQEMTYKAVLIYNHEIFESNELTFHNLDSLQIAHIEDMNGALQIQHGESSYSSYQSYGETGYLLNSADEMLARTLYVDYSGVFGDNSYLDGAVIRWYVPSGASMLKFKTVSNDNGEIALADTNLIKTVSSQLGYDCYTTTLGDNQKDSIQDRSLIYYIKPFYLAGLTNNTVKCEIVKNSLLYEAEINFDFMSYGISGTDYRLMISPMGWRYATTDLEGLSLEFTLVDRNNTIVKLTTNQLNIIPETSNGIEPIDDVEITMDGTGIITIAAGYYGILKITIYGVVTSTESGKRYIDLTTYYSVPWAATNQYNAVGATSIIYNSFGANPVYYNMPYQLYQNKELVNANWHLENITNIDGNIIQGMPILENNILQPACLYTLNIVDENGISIKEYPTIVAENNNIEVWKQDIYIGQNQYGIPVINNWDGKMIIDENNNQILTAMVGAGRKDNNNRFYGVLMGSVPLDENSGRPMEGLFGFHEGKQSFGFRANGTAFLGKSGGGRIEFDGNQGWIQSANYVVDNETNTVLSGMRIDVDDATIKSPGFIFNGLPNSALNEDYAFIGNLNQGYLQLTHNNQLNIVVDSFSLTGNQALGGENLLRETAPTAKDIALNYWAITDPNATIINDNVTSDKSYIFNLTGELSQVYQFEIGQAYTLSGWVKGMQDIDCAIVHYTSIAQPPVEVKKTIRGNNNWQYVSISMTANITLNGFVRFSSAGNFNVWHPKLEKGKIATAWAPNNNDLISYIDNTTIDLLSQNSVFNALTNNGETKGIWLNGNDLFINASILGTSVLRSNNFNGKIIEAGETTIKDVWGNSIYYLNGNIVPSNTPGATQLTTPIYDIAWSDNKTPEGTLWDLNTGRLWAAEFNLKAGIYNTDDFLYLSNTNYSADDTRRLIIGNNFSVNAAGEMESSKGTIGGINIAEKRLSAGGVLYNQTRNSFKATLNYANGVTKIEHWQEDDINNDVIWINEIYEPSTTSATTVYISGFGINTEIFIFQRLPDGPAEEFATYSHKFLREVTTGTWNVEVPKGYYLVINRNPKTTSAPIVSSSLSRFTINDNGILECSNAKIGGTINATNITVSSSGEIAGWGFTVDQLSAQSNYQIILDTATGKITCASNVGWRSELGRDTLDLGILGGTTVGALRLDASSSTIKIAIATNNTLVFTNGTKSWKFDFNNGYFVSV